MRSLRRRLVLPLAAVAALALTSFVVADTTTAGSSRTTPAATLSDAVGDARDALAASGRGYTDASARFRQLVEPDAAELERTFREQAEAYRRQAAAAAEVKGRVDAVEAAGQALFAEWEAEIGEYAGDSLRARSRAQLDEARARYDRLLASMRQAEGANAPALAALRDRALSLKHALNARAVGALDATAGTVQTDARAVQRATETATAEADRFLAAPAN